MKLATYDLKTKKRMIKRIKELREEGLKLEEVATVMAKEGYTDASGGPITVGAVNGLISRARKSGKRRRRTRTPYVAEKGGTPRPVSGLASQIIGILDLDIDDETKLTVIRALVGGAQ